MSTGVLQCHSRGPALLYLCRRARERLMVPAIDPVVVAAEGVCAGAVVGLALSSDHIVVGSG